MNKIKDITLIIIGILTSIYFVQVSFSQNYSKNKFGTYKNYKHTLIQVIKNYGEIKTYTHDGRPDRIHVVDPYNDHLITNTKYGHIDYIRSLKDVWNSGGNKWTRDQRNAYLEDLEAMIYTSKWSAYAKKQKGIENYLPDNKNFHRLYCKYYYYISKKHGIKISDRAYEILIENKVEIKYNRRAKVKMYLVERG